MSIKGITGKELSGRNDILDEYKKRLIILGKKVEVFCAGESFTAIAEGIDDKGCLIIKKDDGTTAVLSSGEVSVRSV